MQAQNLFELSRAGLALSCIILGSFYPTNARAQRTEENAVAESDDAFGKSIGSEKTGLYSAEDVRGFNPVDAGNARIEGLYFDQVDRLSQRLIDSSTIHVGISAQHYPFPAPTGIVDYKLPQASDDFSASLDLERGDYGGPRYSLEARFHVFGDHFGFVGGVGGRHQQRDDGATSEFTNFGVVGSWIPYSNAKILAFFGGLDNTDDEAKSILFPSGSMPPPKIERREFYGQKWADRSYAIRSLGLIAKLPVGENFLEAGLFRSRRQTHNTFADLLIGVRPDGSAAERSIVADGNNLDDSISGEVRLSRKWSSGPLLHMFRVSLRGRHKKRLFGGTQKLSLGPSTAIAADFRPKPNVQLGPENVDDVHQFTYGVSYGANWNGHGSIEASISRSQYRKSVDFADPLRPDARVNDNPLIWNVSASYTLSPRLAAYAGYVKGQEEALIAPETAINRSEAPPAIGTRQIDAGLRYAISSKLNLVAGLFSVRKPYFNLDPTLQYRQLGIVESRGVELSLAGTIYPGISLVAGSVFLDPTISGEAVENSLIGSRPVGSLTRRSVANIDWRLDQGRGAISFDVAIESLSARVANASNSFSAPGRTSYSVGGRFRFGLMDSKALLRMQIVNLFNHYGWQVSSSGGFTYTSSRTLTAQLLIDL